MKLDMGLSFTDILEGRRYWKEQEERRPSSAGRARWTSAQEAGARLRNRWGGTHLRPLHASQICSFGAAASVLGKKSSPP